MRLSYDTIKKSCRSKSGIELESNAVDHITLLIKYASYDGISVISCVRYKKTKDR